MHAALDIGGIDLYKRAKQLSQVQAADVLAMQQGKLTNKQELEKLQREVDSNVSSDYEDIAAEVDAQDDLKLWKEDCRTDAVDELTKGLGSGD